MPIGIVMQFAKVGADKYDAVMKEMGLTDSKKGDWPKGLIAHMAGATPDGGWCVVDLWDSQADCDAFFGSRLMPAFNKVGGLPQPVVTPVQVHNGYRRP